MKTKSTKLIMLLCAMIFALGTFSMASAQAQPPTLTDGSRFQFISSMESLGDEGWFVMVNHRTTGPANRFAMSHSVYTPATGNVGFVPYALADRLAVDSINIIDPPIEIVWHFQRVPGTNNFRISPHTTSGDPTQYVGWISGNNLNLVDDASENRTWTASVNAGQGNRFQFNLTTTGETTRTIAFDVNADPQRFRSGPYGTNIDGFRLFRYTPPAPTVDGTFELISGMDEFGEGFFVMANAGNPQMAMSTNIANASPPGFLPERFTVNNGNIVSPPENIVWHIQRDGERGGVNTFTVTPYTSTGYVTIPAVGAVNELRILSVPTDSSRWAITWNDVQSAFEFAVQARVLSYRSGLGGLTEGPRFAGAGNYNAAADHRLQLFRLGGAVVHAVATPRFYINSEHTTGGNIFTDNISVTIETATVGAEIRFTTDGSEPTATHGTVFTDPIPISSTTTLRAIAINNSEVSDLATAIFTFPINVPNIAAFLALIPANQTANWTGDDMHRITSDLTFVFRGGRNVFIQDATGSLLIDDLNNIIPLTYNTNGQTITGGIVGVPNVFSQRHRMVITAGQPTVAAPQAGTAVQPIVTTIEDLLADVRGYESRFVRLTGVEFPANTFAGSGTYQSITMTQDGETIVCRNEFTTLTGRVMSADTLYDVTGFMFRFNATQQITPRSLYDISATPIITVNHLSHAFGATVEIGNTATFDFDVETVGIPGEVSVALSNTAVFSYAWNAGRDVLTVTFAPATTDPLNETLTLSGAGAQSNAEVVITLTGTGREPGAPSLEFADHTELNFIALVGSPSVEQTVAVDADDLNGQTITYSFVDGTHFSAERVGDYFATGLSGTIDIVFEPTTAGTLRDTLVVEATVNGITVRDSLPLVGEGVGVIGAAPTAQAATDITSSGFTANWTAVDNATSYQVRIYQGATVGTFVRATNVNAPDVGLAPPTYLVVTGLPDNTEFTVVVLARGELGQETDISNPIQVTTAVAEVPIARWAFTGLTETGFGPSPFNVAAHNVNVTAGGLTRHWTIATGGTTAAWGGNNFTAANFDAAVTANQYVTFTLEANALHALSISEIGNYNVRRSGTGPTTGQWQFQIGNGAFVNIGTPITWGGTTNANGNAQEAIDLSGIAALQNVPTGTAVTFRVVLWGATGTGGVWYFNDGGTSGAPGLRIYGELVSTALVATPVFYPAEGNMFGPTNVTITVPGGGADIFYSTDIAAERSEFNPLPASGYVTITETTTLRAFGRIGSDESAMAQAIYTFPVDVATVAEFLAESYTAAAGTMFRITGDLTFVWRQASDQGTVAIRDNVFLKDETGGLLVFDNVVPRSITADYAPGDLITSGLVGTRDVTFGQVRLLTTPHQPELSAPGTPSPLSVEPVDVTMEYLLDNIEEMNARLVRLTDVSFDENHTFAPNAASNAAFSQGNYTMVARSHFQGVDRAVNTELLYDIVGFVWRDVRPVSGELTTTHQIMLRNTDDIVAPPTITISTNAIDFGNQYVNTTSDPRTITVTGADLRFPIAIDSTRLAPNFTAIVAQDWDHYEGGAITITFTPTAEGGARAVLYFYSDDERKDSVVLVGIGVVPTGPALVLSNRTVTFATPQEVGQTSAPQAIVITGVNLTEPIVGSWDEDTWHDLLAGVRISSPDFNVEPGAEWNILTGGTIWIRFTPTAVGERTARMYIESGTEHDTIWLSGTGSDPTSICPREVENNAVVLFPNPVVDVLNIYSEQAIATVSIYSLNGQLVRRDAINRISASIDVSTLPHGTYVVRIVFENGTVLTRTIVK